MKVASRRVYRGLEELESLLPAWEELLAEFPGATTFSTWEWLGPWWRAFGDGRELLAVAFFDDCERLVGLAPLQISRRRVASLFNLRVLRLWGDGSGDSDNLDIPVRPGYEAQVTAALLEFLAKESRRWGICEFNAMPADSPMASELERQLGQRRWGRFREQRVASAISLPETWDAYLDQLASEDRNNLPRYRRRLEKRHGVSFHKCADEAELAGALETLFRLHQQRWVSVGEPGSFGDERRRRFYGVMARSLNARGRLEFWLLDLDGKTVAAQFAMRHKGTVFQLQEGFDPSHGSDRVGYLLRGHVIEQLISQGVRRYDFLAGESPSKARWGARAGQYVSLQFARPYSVGSAYLRMTRGAAEGKEWLREHLPSNAWQALHTLNRKMRRAGMAAPLSG